MNAFKTELQTLIARHVAASNPDRMLRLVETLSSEDVEFHGAGKSSGGTTAPRFVNLGSDGKRADRDHVAVYQTDKDLIWTAAPIGDELDHAQAIKAAATLDLMGAKDWRLPTIQELLSIVDYGRCDPAVDTDHFRGPFGWTWSSTVAKAPAGYAWVVGLGYGGSDRLHQGYHGRALAVRAGQQLGFRL